jgi:SAM-dependent methyltransferase
LHHVRRVLEFPAAYRLFTRGIAGNYRDMYLREYVRPAAGTRILDLGCGPGDVLAHLPETDYLGIDHNPRYIEAARRRFGSRGRFRCEDVAETVVREPASADIVMANALLHHLDDDVARRLLRQARRALKPGGRFVAFDGCFTPGQARAARVLLRMDRGRHVRTPEQYVALAREAFEHVESHVRHDLLRIPYTHHIMVCTAGARSQP